MFAVAAAQTELFWPFVAFGSDLVKPRLFPCLAQVDVGIGEIVFGVRAGVLAHDFGSFSSHDQHHNAALHFDHISTVFLCDPHEELESVVMRSGYQV